MSVSFGILERPRTPERDSPPGSLSEDAEGDRDETRHIEVRRFVSAFRLACGSLNDPEST